jgi:serine/threonine protein kinase
MTSIVSCPFQEGQLVRDYRLRCLLGSSSTGITWAAENNEGQGRALKFLWNLDDPTTRQEIRAIQMVAALEHGHLTPVEKIWTFPKYFAIAMPLAEGTLQDLFDAYQSERGTGIEPIQLCEYLRQAAVALDFLNLQKHKLGSWPGTIQHCGVKPQNLLLFGERVKLVDYNHASPTTRFLPTGTRVSSARYMAPEVWQGRLMNATDQYALAMTYVYLRTGCLAINDTARELRHADARRAVPDLSMLPAGERPIIAKALTVMGHERWKSCTELMAQLTA